MLHLKWNGAVHSGLNWLKTCNFQGKSYKMSIIDALGERMKSGKKIQYVQRKQKKKGKYMYKYTKLSLKM